MYQKLEEKLNSKLLVYVTSDRPGFEASIIEASITQDVIDIFINQLDNDALIDVLNTVLILIGNYQLSEK